MVGHSGDRKGVLKVDLLEGLMVDLKVDLLEGLMVDRKADLMEGHSEDQMEGQRVDRKADRKADRKEGRKGDLMEGQRAAESKGASEGSQRSPLVALALLLLSGQGSSQEVEGRVNRPGHLVLALVGTGSRQVVQAKDHSDQAGRLRVVQALILPKAASEGLLLKSWLSRLHRV